MARSSWLRPAAASARSAVNRVKLRSLSASVAAAASKASFASSPKRPASARMSSSSASSSASRWMTSAFSDTRRSSRRMSSSSWARRRVSSSRRRRIRLASSSSCDGRSAGVAGQQRPSPPPRAVPASEACHGLKLCRLHLVVRLFGDRRHGLVQGAFRLALRLLGLDQRMCKSMASWARISADNCFEAVGLAGLALQAFDLTFQLGGDVFQALQIGFRRAQPEFGLMAAGMQAGDAGGLFQQLPPRLGFWPKSVRRCAPARPWRASGRRSRRRQTAAAHPWRGLPCH